MKMIKCLIFLTFAIYFSGCGDWLIPYKEDFKCNLGAGEGYCGSVVENYKRMENNDEIIQNNSFNTDKFIKDVNESIWLQNKIKGNLNEQYN